MREACVHRRSVGQLVGQSACLPACLSVCVSGCTYVVGLGAGFRVSGISGEPGRASSDQACLKRALVVDPGHLCS